MTPAEIEKIVDKALLSYRSHREWEDLRQEGLVGAWREITMAAGRAAPSRLAWDGARWAVAKYFRSRRCHPNDYYRTDNPNAVRWEEYSEAAVRDREPDFVPALLDQIWCAHVCSDLRRRCSPRQWEIIRLSILEDRRTHGAAAALGLSSVSVRQTVARALRNYRRECGLADGVDP